MKTNEVKVDYKVRADGTFWRTEAVEPLMKQLTELEKVRQLVDAAFCGALICNLFKQHEWLDCFELHLDATPESDDSGGSFRSIYLYVGMIRAVEGAALPDTVTAENAFDAVMARDLLETELEDSNGEIYSTLVMEGEFTDLKLSFDRKAVAGLLDEPEISGRDAFVKLFTDYGELITEIADRY